VSFLCRPPAISFDLTLDTAVPHSFFCPFHVSPALSPPQFYVCPPRTRPFAILFTFLLISLFAGCTLGCLCSLVIGQSEHALHACASTFIQSCVQVSGGPFSASPSLLFCELHQFLVPCSDFSRPAPDPSDNFFFSPELSSIRIDAILGCPEWRTRPLFISTS